MPRPLARPVGYLLIAVTLISGAAFAVFTIREFRDPGAVIRVRFPEISTLSAGDAVLENGVETGRVERIALEPDGSAVAALRLHRRELPSRDARFVNFSHSLMGARKVWIRPGTSPRPLDTSRIQEGVFAPGLPETLHRVRVLNDRIAAWGESADKLLGGGDSAAVLRIVNGMERAFTRLAALETSLEDASGDLRAGVERLTAFGTEASAAASAADTGVGRAGKHVAAARLALVNLEADLATSLSRLETMAAMLGADTGIAGRLLADRSLYDSLVGGVEKLTTLARDFRLEGLGDSLKVRPRFFGGRDR